MGRTAARDDSVQVSLVELRQLEEERIRARERDLEEARRAETERARTEASRRADAEAARAAERARIEAENERAVRVAAIEADARIELERLAAERARHQADSARAAAVSPPPARRGWIAVGFVVLAAAQLAALFATSRDTPRAPSVQPAISAFDNRLDHVESALAEMRDQLRQSAPPPTAEPNPAPATKKPKPVRPKPTPRAVRQPSHNGPVELDCDPALPLCASER